MGFKIGFMADHTTKRSKADTVQPETIAPRKSLVQVYFPKRGNGYTYYNDKFDLKVGDAVFVEGKLEGVLGHVTEVSYSFKIKVSDYKRVIAVADTTVKGSLNIAGAHFVAFDRSAIPAEKVRTWYLPPVSDEEEIVVSRDDESFPLDDLSGLKIKKEVAQRGHEYYLENRVCYLCVDNERGYAIVEGSKPYEVEFEYRDGRISNLICNCFCNYTCKHEFAAVLQLSDLLDRINESYAEEYSEAKYFAAVVKTTLLNFAVYRKQTGTVTF